MESSNSNRGIEFILKVLALFSKHEITENLFWRCDEEYAPVTFWVNTNDLFFWGSADGEEITEDNLHILEQSIEDCIRIDPEFGEIYGGELFACRINRIRPQGAAYPKNKNLWPLFNECGPERRIELGNPYKPGDYKP